MTHLQSASSITCSSCSLCNVNSNGDFIAVIPSGNTVIAASAFSSCSRLIGIVTPTSVNSIGSNAFYRSGLTSVVVPTSVTFIDQGAFQYCGSLREVFLPTSLRSIPYIFLNSARALQLITIPTSVVSIDNYAFAYCSSLKAVAILSTAIYIGPYAFYGNSNLISINATSEICEKVFNSCRGTCTQFRGCPTRSPAPAPTPANITCSTCSLCNAIPRYDYFTAVIPSGDMVIAANAFKQCYLLVAVIIPTSVTTIGISAFYQSGFTSIVVPTRVTFIDQAAFSDCYNLREVSLPTSLTSIPSNFLYYASSLQSIVIPTSIVSIGSYAFFYSGLTSVVVPTSVTFIDSYAFALCTSLQQVSLPTSLRSIPSGFLYCTFELQSIVIPASIVSIWWFAFAGSGLKKVVFLTNSTSIIKNVFRDCSVLQEVSLPTTLKSIPSYFLYYYSAETVKSIVIPTSITYIGSYAFYKSGLTSVVVPTSITFLTNYAFAYCSNLRNVSLPTSLRSIPSQFLYNTRALNSIVIPTSVVSIGGYALSSSNLTSIVVPTSVTFIGVDAFSNCSSLCEVSLPTSLRFIPSRFLYAASALQSIVIPTSVASIDPFAFAYCRSLKAVVILPTSISISSSAFYGDNNLTRIDATPEICAKVVKSCIGTCTKFQFCPTRSPVPASSPVPAPLPAGIIAAIVISAVVGAAIVGLLLWWKYYRRKGYGAVGIIEMQTLPEQDGFVEARALPQGELLDQESTYPIASAIVIRGDQQAVFVSNHEIAVQAFTIGS